MNTTLAVVVTYNRKQMLLENIEHLLQQKDAQTDILIVDNNSSDGTFEAVTPLLQKENIFYINTNKNIGGAGGFNIGVKEAAVKGYDYCWLMDDDTFPTDTALASLLNKAKILNNEFSYLCSVVKFNDTELAFMNGPTISENWTGCYDKMRDNNLVLVESCSFVSCLVNMQYAKKAGLPIKEFFIYGDDLEYTLRLSRLKTAYWDLDSVVFHKMKNNENTTRVEDASPERVSRIFYTYRNRMFIYKKTGLKAALRYVLKYLLDIVRVPIRAKNLRLKRVYFMTCGIVSGIFFNPKIEGCENE